MIVTLNFLPRTGLSYFMLLRPIKEDKRIVLIQPNGIIINFSKKFEKEINTIGEGNKVSRNIFLCVMR